jgi:hypothetical protein
MSRIFQTIEVPQNGGLEGVLAEWYGFLCGCGGGVFQRQGFRWDLLLVDASCKTLSGEHGDADTMGVMDRDCAVCHQPIQDQERWFRVL